VRLASKADQIHLSVTPGFSPVIEEKERVRTVLTVYCFRRNQCGSFVMENITAGETVETVITYLAHLSLLRRSSMFIG